MAVQRQRRYRFTAVPWYWWVLNVGGMTFAYVAAYHRDVLPYSWLSVVGTFIHWMAYDHHNITVAIWWCGFAVHICEGLYAWWLCRGAGMNISDKLKWYIQTTLVGWPSLLSLVKMTKKKTS